MQQLGSQYRLETRIGFGAMGEVWKGVDARGNAYAFKLLLPQLASNAELVKRFVAERQLLTSINHPNVVGVHDLVIEGSTLAIVMDLVSGTDLKKYLEAMGTLTQAETCQLGAQLASGLAAIHQRKIIHRDVKPANTLLDTSSQPLRVRLTDFGVARLVDDSASPEQTTIMAGTPMYMSPEVLNGALPTVQSDLYALGIVLYEMLVGHTPFAGMAAGPLMQAHMTLNPGPIPGINPLLWQVILLLVDKDPAQRPPSAAAVATRLQQLASHVAGQPPLPKPASPPAPVPAPAPARPPHGVRGNLTQLPPATGHVPYPPAPQPVYPAPPQPYGTPVPHQASVPPLGQAPTHVNPVVQPSYVSYIASAEPPAPPPKKKRSPLLVVLFLVLMVGLGALAAFLTLHWNGKQSTTTAPSQSPTPVAASPTTGQSPTTAGSTPAPRPSGTPSTPAPRPSSSTPNVVNFPPPGATLCPGSTTLAVNSDTTCEFAGNVEVEYRLNGAGTVTAYSPVTEQWYTMACAPFSTGVVQCTGGINAAVYILE